MAPPPWGHWVGSGTTRTGLSNPSGGPAATTTPPRYCRTAFGTAHESLRGSGRALHTACSR
eukprot:12277847-Prorocentrum_lima.AAC.1